jgi:hypothetical protein
MVRASKAFPCPQIWIIFNIISSCIIQSGPILKIKTDKMNMCLKLLKQYARKQGVLYLQSFLK